MKNSYQQIIDSYETFSKSQKRIADFIISNLHDVMYFPITKLVHSIGVSHATIVRFAQYLGYKGFNDLRNDLFGYYREYLDPESRMKQSLSELERHPLSYESITRREIVYLEKSIATVDDQVLKAITEAICTATRVYVFGIGPDEHFAIHFHFRLRRMKINAIKVTDAGRVLLENLLDLRSTDLAIIYSFAKPSKEFQSLKSILNKHEVPIALITDMRTPPIIRSVRYLLHAERGPLGTFPSPLVPISITNALLLGVASNLGEQAFAALRELGELRDLYLY